MAKWLKLYAIYIFQQTWPMSLHYLVKRGCSKSLPNTGFMTIRLLRFGVKVKRAYCRDNFLAQKPLPDMRRLSGDDILCFNRTAPRLIEHATPSLSWTERDTGNASSSKRLCPCTRGTFRAQILTILSRSVMTTNNSAKYTIFSVYCVLFSR